MEKKSMPLKNRIIISSLCGLIVLVIMFVYSLGKFRTYGDLPETIERVESAIQKELEKLGNKTILLKKESAKSYDIIDELEIATWDNIDKITRQLVYTNERIAKAKALVHFTKNPFPQKTNKTPLVDEKTGISLEGFELADRSDLWEKRHQVSNQNWKVKSLSLKILKSLGVAIASFIGSFVIVISLLSILPWFWYFLLERLHEISQAIRGK